MKFSISSITYAATLLIAAAATTTSVNAQQLDDSNSGSDTGNNSSVVNSTATTNTTAPIDNDKLCTSNIQTCRVACGGEEPASNTCDSSNLQWDCQCPAGMNQTIIDQAFPVAFHECQKEYTDCVNSCVSTGGSGQTECVGNCMKNYFCGTEKAAAPKSKTPAGTGEQTPDPNNNSAASQIAASVGALIATVGLLAIVA